jgi:hypothetical protein
MKQGVDSQLIPCPSCNTLNQTEKLHTIFHTEFDWFICINCDDTYVLSQYGDWLESNPYQGYNPIS